jgi:nickel-type superoxide dismutase maturation protease
MRWPLWRVAVAEQSMEPALRPGDWLLVWRRPLAGRPPRIRPGQLVIARHPGRPAMLLAKRAIRHEAAGWWLASDNPGAGAVDSRAFGVVPPGLIEGRVLLRYWPLRLRAGR